MTPSSTPCKFNHGHTHDGEDQTNIKSIDLDHIEDMYGLINEVFLVRRCCQHANILPNISGFFKKDDELCLVMPDLTKSFSSIAILKNGLSVEMVAYVVMETLKALDCMHVRGGRVHGNLNIENVFSNRQACVKLGFPTRLINPSQTIYPSHIEENRLCDVTMVGLLALDLFIGESYNKKYFGCFQATKQKRLPKVFEDFIALSRGGQVTIAELMQHRFFSEFCEFDRYKENLKKLINRKLSNR